MPVDTEVLHEGELVDAIRESTVESNLEETIIDEAYVLGEDEAEVVSSGELITKMLERTMKGFDANRIHRETDNSALIDVTKSVAGTTQSESELGETDISTVKVVEPPYPPELVATFLEVDGTHYRSVVTKVTDSVLRKFTLDPINPVKTEGMQENDVKKTVSQEEVDKDIDKIQSFIKSANEIIGFEGVMHRAAMDYEAVGWAAIEVIRSVDMVVRKISHIPAVRVRVLRGWKGFVEQIGNGKFIYYQNFGDKVLSNRKNPINDKRERYDPDLDGELEGSDTSVSFIDRTTGEPTSNINKAASELLYIPRHHSNTIYYGYTDAIPAMGDMLANVHIRDYSLQFFDHNTIPRYAIIIKGAKLSPKVQQAITKYFSTHVKGRAHKTLLIPISQVRGEVEIKFEKLSDDERESSFQDTRKNNAQGVMTSHGMSPALLGINDASALGSGKGLSQAEIYKDRIITPAQSRWSGELNHLFRLGLGVTKVLLAYDPLDIRDKEAEMRMLTAYGDRGILTINQILKITGLGEPVPGGDRNFFKAGNEIVFIDELADMPTMTERKEQENQRLVEAQDKDREMKKNEPSDPKKGREPFDNLDK